MEMNKRFGRLYLGRILKYLTVLVLGVLLFSAALYVAYGVDPLATLRIIFGLVYVLFLPGFLFCWVMFPDSSEISSMERIGLSMGLSSPLTLTTIIAVSQLLGLPITSETIIRSLGVLMVTMASVVAIKSYLRGRKQH